MDRSTIARLIVDRLESERPRIEAQWNKPDGTTTHYFVVDDLLPAELAKQVYAAFPRDGNGFFSRDTFREKKRTSSHLSEYPTILGEITYAIQSPEVIGWCAEVTGIEQLEPDPTLYAGGLSMMFKGDFLNPHIDNSHDAQRNRYRRLNALYYVSPNWSVEKGGNFELWNDDRTKPVTIISGDNRLVIMETNKTSWHSVSPVASDLARCCVSSYFFTKDSPDATGYFHVTSFDGRPDEKMKKVVSAADNALRNVVAKTLKLGRGKDEANTTKK
ncbi:Rps23 Pro-64 3,4-dihydroxylase Tpa1-like proline 4-hydroxylase [Bradyrhizobium sp. S3.3.6]|uniref:2OG-Fe(II) oxygenase n=1 Tax=Bradyrhizobium sp. S3.3.6 TaxID=3156429 RepID=UPI0033993DC3